MKGKIIGCLALGTLVAMIAMPTAGRPAASAAVSPAIPLPTTTRSNRSGGFLLTVENYTHGAVRPARCPFQPCPGVRPPDGTETNMSW